MAEPNVVMGKGLDTSYMNRNAGETMMGGLAALAQGFSERHKFELAQQIQKAKDKEDARRFDQELQYKKEMAEMQFGGEMSEKDWFRMQGELEAQYANQGFTPEQARAASENSVNGMRGITEPMTYVKDKKGKAFPVTKKLFAKMKEVDPTLTEMSREEYEKTFEKDKKGLSGPVSQSLGKGLKNLPENLAMLAPTLMGNLGSFASNVAAPFTGQPGFTGQQGKEMMTPYYLPPWDPRSIMQQGQQGQQPPPPTYATGDQSMGLPPQQNTGINLSALSRSGKEF